MRSDTRGYLLAAALALAGAAFAALVVYRFIAGMQDPARFLAPGAGIVVTEKPGSFVIWHEYRTLYEGRTYEAATQLPGGARLRITDPQGRDLEVVASGGTTMRSDTAERASVARFDSLVAGPHRIAIDGDFEPRVIAVGEDFMAPLLTTIGLAMAVAVIGIGAGGALALYVFLKGTSGPPNRAGRQALAGERDAQLRRLTALVYGLHAVALVVGVTSIAAVIINYVKRDEVQGTWLESHFTWQIRTFWFSLLWGVIGLATAVLIVGILVLVVAAVWFVYRIVKGWTELNDGRPVGTAS